MKCFRLTEDSNHSCNGIAIAYFLAMVMSRFAVCAHVKGQSNIMPIGTTELVVSHTKDENSRIEAIVTQASQADKTLFLGRFLTDLVLSVTMLSQWKKNGVVLRQYGNSYYVNACPTLADVRRVELGVEESEIALRSGKYDVVLLSQILNAVDEHLLTSPDIQRLANACPKHVSLILTGDKAPSEIAVEHKYCQEN